MVDFFVTNVVAQLGYCLVWIILYIVSSDYASELYSTGLWVVWMGYVTKICESDPEGSIQLCCLPMSVTKRYYPLVVIGLLWVLGWQVPYDLIVGYLVNVVACRFFDGSFLRLTNSGYRKL